MNIWERKRLRRFDGEIYLDRWGIEHPKVGGIFLHKMKAPDPGLDLHCHPWTFGSFILSGGYLEERSPCATACDRAAKAESLGNRIRGRLNYRRRWTWQVLRMDECHRITHLMDDKGNEIRTCWSLVIHGPKVRGWGFYLPTGFMDEHTYDRTVRAERRDLWNEV